MIALVTGATGLVGSYVVQRLAADGWRVRALVRQPDAARWLTSIGVAELSAGDVLDAASLARAARGCGLVVHAAAAVTPRGGWEAFRLPNVDGTANVLAAAGGAGARLVHVSSVAVYGPDARYRDGALTDENTPLAPLPDGAFYARSKRESEALVMQAHAAGRVWATAVRPTVVYGRGDRQFVPRLARLYRTGVAPVVGRGDSALAVVHAANVAAAIALAARSDVAGGRAYNVTEDAEPVSVADFARLAGLGLGRDLRVLHVPPPLATTVLRAAARVAGVVRGPAAGAMAASSLDFLTRGNPFCASRARRELGWRPPVRPSDGVPDAFRSLREGDRAPGGVTVSVELPETPTDG